MTKEKKKFYRDFFALFFALVLQNVVTISVNLADNIMIGGYSESALSGIAAVNQVQFVYQQLLMGLGDGLVIFGSRFWGERDLSSLKKISSIVMHAALFLCIILFVLVSLFPYQTIHIFTTDETIIAEGMKYLKIIRFTYIFFAITQVLLATLRSVETVKVAFYLSIMTLVVNCSINYTLIYGRFGAPQMGGAGAAVGTLVARILEVIVLIAFIVKKEKNLHLDIASYGKHDWKLHKDYFHIAIPILITSALWGFNVAAQTVILGHMSATAIAANSMASTLFLMVKSAGIGAASSASVLIGKTIGTGDIALVKIYAKRMQKLFLLIGVLSGICLYFLRIPILGLYNLSAQTRDLANTFLIIMSVVVVGMSYQMPTNNGIIKGGGHVKFVTIMDLISIWCIVIPVSFAMAFVFNASPVVVVCCLNADQIFKCVPAFLEANYGNWIRKITTD